MPSQQNNSQKKLYADAMNYFRSEELSPKGTFAVHLKPFFFLSLLIVSYISLVFFSAHWWTTLLYGILLVFAMGGIGFGFAHDACHGSFSKKRSLNKLAGCGYDLIGGSSYVWSWKHNVLHHRNPNQNLFDPDIQTHPFLRLSKQQERYGFHRYQQFYFFVLYMFIGIRWQLWQDFATYFKGRLVGRKFPKPRGIDFIIFWGGKAFFLAFAFLIPSLYHPFSLVVGVYLAIMMCLGLVLGLILQVAHSTEGVLGEHKDNLDITEFQIRNSSNYCPDNWFLTWYSGGLNYHIEHHLFPNISSIHYPALSKIVKAHCQVHEIKYQSHSSYLTSLTAHYRYLKNLGHS